MRSARADRARVASGAPSPAPLADPSVPADVGPPDAARDQAERRAFHPLPWVVLTVVVLYPSTFGYFFLDPALQNWATIFISVTLQALPFLVLGVTVSAALAAFVPASWLVRSLPRRPSLAVPVAALAGAVLPGCECSSVPVARRLVSRGVAPAAGLTFLLAAPAINPVVLVATAVAFPGRPEVVLARFAASLVTAITVGWLCRRFGVSDRLETHLASTPQASHRHDFVATASSDFLQAGGFLVAGAMAVATLQTIVPESALRSVTGSGAYGVLALALLAVLLSVCSEADAFVAAGLPQFSMTARLAFLVVGPMVDLKLIALQSGTFGWRFASRFAPLTFVTAVAVSVLVGSILL